MPISTAITSTQAQPTPSRVMPIWLFGVVRAHRRKCRILRGMPISFRLRVTRTLCPQKLLRKPNNRVHNRAMARFRDRDQAGREVARLLAERGVARPAVVLALPRGGVPVAVPVAAELGAPLDVLVVRKLRTPGRPELAFGAVAGGGVCWRNSDIAVPEPAAQRLIEQETEQVRALELRYRPEGFTPAAVAGRTVVLVDDGIATGATVAAAVESARTLGAREVIVAAPIAPPDAVALLERRADRVDIVEIRSRFGAVSVLYDDFREVPDEAVPAALAAAQA